MLFPPVFDWHDLHADAEPPAVVDPRRRLRICAAGAAALMLLVFGRAVQLEVSYGEAFRQEAAQPLRREQSLPGVRGRILAADGAVLACDRKVQAVAVHYRYLEQPANANWLRYTARARLTKTARKDPGRVAAEESRVLAERDALARRLCGLCGVTESQWRARAARVQARVEQIAETVNRRREMVRLDREAAAPEEPGSLPAELGRVVRDALQSSVEDGPEGRITVAEELDYHVMVADVPLSVVARIEGQPELYPGVQIVERASRSYPAGALAAHVLGHLGRVEPAELQVGQEAYNPEDYVGRTGLERRYEALLRGRRGTAIELTDRTGRVLSSLRRREPGVGRDLVLTIDSRLQRAAEGLLDAAIARRELLPEAAPPGGGAVVVMDVRTGALLAAASAPRFDPNRFVAGSARDPADLLDDPGRPLFDRASRMALPPASVLKIVSAIALLESGQVDPREPVLCRGYLKEPDRQRCAVYVRRGVGHGEVALSDALCTSCNVYFFQQAGRVGPEALADCALRLGFGRPTGVDLPFEAAGTLPTPATIERIEGHAWRPGDTDALAIGQGSVTATPLQVARLVAAVANGGKLVTPHVVSRLGLPTLADGQAPAEESLYDPIRVPPPVPVKGLRHETLAIVGDGLRRAVADAEGTAHASVWLEGVGIAGKTGTAEAGTGQPHAWFAGYVPADRPKLAVVVALEHAGDAATAAGPVARRLVMQMQQLGLL